jgi:SAM-dependent methyltransferase
MAPTAYQTAQALAQSGQIAAARDAYAACLREHPGFLPAYAGLARLFAGTGDTNTALQLLTHALERCADADDLAAIVPPLGDLLAAIRPKAYHPKLDAALRACLDHPAVDPQRLARTAAALLLLKHATPDVEGAGADPLWTAFLTRCINTDPAMEARLAAMRDALLTGGDENAPLLPALAVQAFASEYVWAATAGEGRLALLGRAPEPGDALPDIAPWRQLADLRTHREAERVIAETLPSAGQSTDTTSAAVRAQYEANLYPRWRAPPSPAPRDLRAFFAGLPHIDAAALPPGPLAILVAGCGTGFEAIDLARTDPAASVTALDLSRASLAYGARMAGALGIANIGFVQGDILALDRLKRSFGLVTSTGVLHHMADPAAGLASIAAVLAPGGLARIALYSRRARAPVRLAHALIRERGWHADPAGIRAFRAHVLALPAEHPLAVLRDSDDFYTMSGCRDLVFHVHEHQFAPAELAELIAAAGLRLTGFDAAPQALSAFRALHGPHADPLDLRLWDAVEAGHPFLFAGMYQLLAQKL